MARGLDWKVLVWLGCAACSNGGDDTMLMENGAMSAGTTSTTPTSTQTSGGSAGKPGSMSAAAGRPAMMTTTTTTTTTTMTGNTAAAGKPAATSGAAGMSASAAGASASSAAGHAATAAAGSGAAGSSATGSAGASASMSGAAGKSGAAGSSSTAAGSGGAAGKASAGAAGMGAAGGMATAEHADLGKGDGSDLVLIGDSWMSNTLQIEGTGGGIAPALQATSMQPYRNYGLQGVMLLEADTFGPPVPTQWDDAKRVNPKIKTVVMTGGGNDIIQGSPTLQDSCKMGTDECKKKLIAISDALDKLWTQMSEDGVEDIVYIHYTANTGTLAPELQGDKGLPTPQICLSGKVRCHGVETTDIVAATDLAADGIHPLASANTRIAMRIWELLQKEGIRR